MGNSVKLLLYMMLAAAAPLTAQAQNLSFEKTLAATDAAMAADFEQALTAAEAPPEGPSAAPSDEAAVGDAARYLPVNLPAVYEYEYTSSEFAGAKRIRLEYFKFSDEDNSLDAEMTVTADGVAQKVSYQIFIKPAGVYSTDSPLASGRMEFPLPLVQGKTWTDGSDAGRISTLKGRTSTPAGKFTSCLKITTKLNGGDSGIAERYYAPGVGLVYERIISEDMQKSVKLISRRLK